MSITVRDCLKLPSLRNAEVLAGHAGLDQYVSTVSVLEYAKTFAMANPLFLGNEIILTAFISIKDDVDARPFAGSMRWARRPLFFIMWTTIWKM